MSTIILTKFVRYHNLDCILLKSFQKSSSYVKKLGKSDYYRHNFITASNLLKLVERTQ